MPGTDAQRNVFEFLRDHLETQEPFTKKDLVAVTDWKGKTPGTYWSKQFKPFVTDLGQGRFRVSEAFRQFTDWNRFRQHVTQVRTITAESYRHFEYDDVLIYEFFMPLTNEAPLRVTLDALFYKDTIMSKLRSCDPTELNAQMGRADDEDTETYLDRVCKWIAGTFLGYSINHVNGRFRIEDLMTHEDAASIERNRRYLIDETTAVTRFIFPCDENEVERVRWFFNTLFVESIIQVVNGEDEIWMVESGLRNRLHIWRVEQAE